MREQFFSLITGDYNHITLAGQMDGITTIAIASYVAHLAKGRYSKIPLVRMR